MKKPGRRMYIKNHDCRITVTNDHKCLGSVYDSWDTVSQAIKEANARLGIRFPHFCTYMIIDFTDDNNIGCYKILKNGEKDEDYKIIKI